MSLKREINTIHRVGVHTSIAGGISKAADRAASLNCSTMQIFSHNPRQWKHSAFDEGEAKRFKILREKYNIHPVFVHVSYLINLATCSESMLSKSIDLLCYELRNADMIGAEYVVLHTGSARGRDERDARKRAVSALLRAFKSVRSTSALVLENTAGEKGDITSSIKALGEIIDNCQSDRIAGICVDTCHAFSAGYDLRGVEGVEGLLTEIKDYAGFDKLKLIHLNDSKRPLGSGIDRHEHIGKGYIGLKGFKNILNDKILSKVPIILETPKNDEDDDRKNLGKVFRILNHG